MSKQYISKQFIDYASVSCANGKITHNFYTDDARSGDKCAMDFLYTKEELKFLSNNILFYTTKHSSDIEKSFEYKLGNLNNEDVLKFIGLWEDDTCVDWITKLSAYDVIGDFKNGGIYFFGVEYPKGRVDIFDNAVLKVYFSGLYNNSSGVSKYINEFFIGKITNCGIEFFNEIKDKIAIFIDLGFNIHLVGWNHDKVLNINKYKIYFIASKNIDIDGFYKEAENFCDCDILKECSNINLCMQGFALCKDDNAKQSINIYFRGK